MLNKHYSYRTSTDVPHVYHQSASAATFLWRHQSVLCLLHSAYRLCVNDLESTFSVRQHRLYYLAFVNEAKTFRLLLLITTFSSGPPSITADNINNDGDDDDDGGGGGGDDDDDQGDHDNQNLDFDPDHHNDSSSSAIATTAHRQHQQ